MLSNFADLIVNFATGCKLLKTFMKVLKSNEEYDGRKPLAIYLLNTFIDIQLLWKKYFGRSTRNNFILF